MNDLFDGVVYAGKKENKTLKKKFRIYIFFK